MSKIRICDRCGNRIDKRYFLKLKPVRYVVGVEREGYNWYDGIVTYRDSYDLCNDCYKTLVELLTNKETKSCQDTQ